MPMLIAMPTAQLTVPPIEPSGPPPRSWNVGSRPATDAPLERTQVRPGRSAARRA